MSEKKTDKIPEQRLKWTRRGFAGGVISGIGLLATRLAERSGAAAHVSMKEASHYESLDSGEREEK